MGINGEFKQVSPYLLEKLKEYPDFAELFFNAKYLSDSPFWQEFTIDSDNPDDVEWFEEFSNFAAETIEKFKQDKPKEFELLREDIPLILNEGKDKYLEIDKNWRALHFLLTGYDESFRPEFLTGVNEEERLPAINAVLSGSEIEYAMAYGYVRYLTADEVKQIAESLSSFNINIMRKRLNLKGWKENDCDYLFNSIYTEFVSYYQAVANKGNAMFLYLT